MSGPAEEFREGEAVHFSVSAESLVLALVRASMRLAQECRDRGDHGEALENVEFCLKPFVVIDDAPAQDDRRVDRPAEGGKA